MDSLGLGEEQARPMNGNGRFNHTPTVHLSDDAQAVRDIRKLIIDCCRQHGNGHGGSAIGMAPLAIALWGHTMRYSPSNPAWYDRDRFVLSNGHAGILLYVMLYLTGYQQMTMDDLKLYASPKKYDRLTRKAHSTNAHCHPERAVPGIEITTGALGQGIANSVGLAIAAKQQAALFNDDGNDFIQSRIYCTTGDGCLQEGVALEAISVAGHLGLDNLVLCYDNNGVTCDGPLNWITAEDINMKMKATGWHVLDVFTGDTSVDDIKAALALAKSCKGKPTFINIRTTIGYGTSTAGTFKSHCGTYSDTDAALYQYIGETPTHTISQQTKAFFLQKAGDGNALERAWNIRLQEYLLQHPLAGERLKVRMSGNLKHEEILQNLQIPKDIQAMATRDSNGFVYRTLIASMENLFAGGADCFGPARMGDPEKLLFHRDNYSGRVIRYGIREHAMASISNGLAAYSPNAFVPITAAFFMFYLYAAAGVRMGALNKLHVIHIATHDSIAEGQNGPTHQPVEVDSLYRAMPSLLYFRPSNAEEVIGAWMVALGTYDRSSIISVARDACGRAIPNTDRAQVACGGYTVVEQQDADVTLISSGSEVAIAVTAAEGLLARGLPTRVVSMPCLCLFEQQSDEYKERVLSTSRHVVSLEPYISTVWARYCTASISMESFGYSASTANNYARFGLDAESVVEKVERYVHESRSRKTKREVKWTRLE